ncbi:UNVERIFIED_CONTAM: hypothetical protein FKN15_015857 [Acipenser sinensis]
MTEDSGMFRMDLRGAGRCEDGGPAQGEGQQQEEEEPGPESDPRARALPYPELAPVVFFCLKQTTCPRSGCIRMVCNPYPSQRRDAPLKRLESVLGDSHAAPCCTGCDTDCRPHARTPILTEE